MIVDSEGDNLWDNLQDQFSENPSGFFKILQTLSEESGLKMFKAINLIKDEIVMIKELIIMRGQNDQIMKISSSQTNKIKQQFEIKVFDKYLCKKNHENAIIWLELEYCQMGSIYDITQITKLAFSEGEIAFMIDQIIQYLQELEKDGQLQNQKPFLDSRHLFLTNQGVLKIFPFPLFSQQIKNENIIQEINTEIIQVIGLMDNNISGDEENFSEEIKKLVKALKEDQDYPSILKTKIIQENKDKFEYIKRSIYNTRKRAIENYRKASMCKFVPDTLKNGNSITDNQSSQKNNENHNSSKNKQQSLNDYDDNYSDNSPTQDKKYQKDKKGKQNLKNNINSKKIHQNHFNELSQDLKDISQINYFQNPYFSSLESNGSLCQFLMKNSQHSIQSRNGNYYPSFLFQSSGTGNIDFQNLNELKSITDRKFDEEEKDDVKESDQQVQQINQQKDISDSQKKYDVLENKSERFQGIENVKIRQILENHSERKQKVKILVKERKESDNYMEEIQESQKDQLNKHSITTENNLINKESNLFTKNLNQIKQIEQQFQPEILNMVQNLEQSPQCQNKLDKQSLNSSDRESNYSYESEKITSRSERQFGQFEKEVVSFNNKEQQQYQEEFNSYGDKEVFQLVQVQNDIIEEQSEITSSFPQNSDTNIRVYSQYENQNTYSPKLEYNDIHQMNMKRKISNFSDEKKQFYSEKQNYIEYEKKENNSNVEEDPNKLVLQYISNRQTYDSFEVSEVKSCQVQQYETNDQNLQNQEYNDQSFAAQDDFDQKYNETTLSSVNPQEYETFGGGSTTIAPTQEGTHTPNSERNQKEVESIEQIFYPIKGIQEEFIINGLPTSRQINSDQKDFTKKFSSSQKYFCGCGSEIDETNEQCEMFSDISDRNEDQQQEEKEPPRQSLLKEEWKMNKIYVDNGNLKNREDATDFLQRNHSQQTEMFQFQDQIMNERNSSPIRKLSKKNESPKVEMPSLLQSSASSASPSSSNYQSQRQPFQIRHLQQIVCNSTSSKNNSHYKYRQKLLTQQSPYENNGNLNQNRTISNDHFQQIVLTTEQHQTTIEQDNEDEESYNKISQYFKQRNYSTPFSKNSKEPISFDNSPKNSKQKNLNCFFDSSKMYSQGYEATSASSKPSQDESIRQSNQSYSYNQSSKNKNSNKAVLYKNRKINEGSVDISINSSYYQQTVSSGNKLFSIKQSHDSELSLVSNNIFSQIENNKFPEIKINKLEELNIKNVIESQNIDLFSNGQQELSKISGQSSQLIQNSIQIQSKQPLQNFQMNSYKPQLNIQSSEYLQQQKQQTQRNPQLKLSYLENNQEIKSCQNVNSQQFLFKNNQFNQTASTSNLEHSTLIQNELDNQQKNQQQKIQNYQDYQYSQNKIQQQQQQIEQVQQQKIYQPQQKPQTQQKYLTQLNQTQKFQIEQQHQQQNQSQQAQQSQQQGYQQRQFLQQMQYNQIQQQPTIQNKQQNEQQQQQRILLLNQQSSDILFKNDQQKKENSTTFNSFQNKNISPFRNQQNPQIKQNQNTNKINNQSQLQVSNDQYEFHNEQQNPVIYYPQSPINSHNVQQKYCFQPISPLSLSQNQYLQQQAKGDRNQNQKQTANRPLSIENLNKSPKKSQINNLISTINHHSNLQLNKSKNEQILNEFLIKSNNGKKIRKFSDNCEYVENNSTLETGREVGIKQLCPNQTIDIFDTSSTDESVQTNVKGVSLIKNPSYINRKIEMQNIQIKNQVSKHSNESFPSQNSMKTYLNEFSTNKSNNSTTPTNGNSQNQDFTRNFSMKLFN